VKWTFLIAGFVALLTGCQTPPTTISIPEPIEVRIPVPVSCVSSMPAKPELLTDQELATQTDYGLVLALRREQLLLRTYVSELEAILMACTPGV
jgi:uncharacterized lipoprotein YajG